MVNVPYLIASLFALAMGLGYLLRPQLMFWIRHFPLASGDGLTESGEQTYRYVGVIILLVGGLTFLWALVA